jgi:osmotically-inducible protein OsmY
MNKLNITAMAAAIALAFSAGALAAQGMSKDEYKAGKDKIAAEYKAAKAGCDSLTANAKDVCMAEAKGKQKAATAELKASNKPAKEKSTASASKKESPGEYVDDAVITTKVKAAVLEEPSLKSAEINVETSKGTVQLTGFVRSRADINKAVEVAKGVKGVKSVKNDMILKGTQ